MNDTRELTDEQCDEFRRTVGSFNDMVRTIYAAGRASMAKVPEHNNHWKLGMRVMQSELYRLLDCEERAICDELIAQNPYMAKRPKDDTQANIRVGGLLPCPFCGGVPEYDNSETARWYQCDDCGARIGSSYSGTEERLRKMWNRRASPQPTPSIPAAYCNKCGYFGPPTMFHNRPGTTEQCPYSVWVPTAQEGK